MVGSGSEDKEVVLITLRRPLIYIQPIAVDKAILVWLNYKNAYEYWAEQRSSLNKEVLTATQQVKLFSLHLIYWRFSNLGLFTKKKLLELKIIFLRKENHD